MIMRRFVLPATLLLAALLALSQINQHLVLASDNAAYIVVSQALALGRGYVMVNEPAAPPMNLYPWGYPLLLAAMLRVSDAVADPLTAVIPLKLVSAAFFLASLPLVYLLLRRRQGQEIAVLVALLVAVNPSLLSLATEVLSETQFVFLTLLGLLLASRYTDNTESETQPQLAALALGGLALVAAYYTRTAGLAALAALPLYLVYRRRWRAGLALAVVMAVLALPWFLRSSAAPAADTPFFARSYIHQVLAQAPYSDATVTPGGLLLRIVRNSLAYAVDILPGVAFPHLARLGSVAPVLSWAFAALFALGFILQARRGPGLTGVAVAVYWLLLSLFVWVLGYRYIVLVLPFALAYLLSALHWLAGLLLRILPAQRQAAAERLALAAVFVVAGVLAASALVTDVRRAERNLGQTIHQTLAEANAGNPEWTRYLEAASWLEQNTPAEAVIVSRKPDLLYLLTHRRTLEYPYTTDTSALLSSIKRSGACFVLQDAFTWTRSTEIYLAPAMQGAPGVFWLVHQSDRPVTRIWQACP